MIGHGAAHDESAFRFIAAANILENKNVKAGSEFGFTGIDGLGRVPVYTIGRPLHEEGKRSRIILGAQYNGMEFDVVAHGDHDFLASVLGLVELERQIANLAGVSHTFLSDTVEAYDPTLCGAEKLEADRDILWSERVFGLREEFYFATAQRFAEQAGTLQGGGKNEIGIIVVNILPDEGRQLVGGNLEFWWWSGFLRDGEGGANEEKKHIGETTV